MRSMIKKAGKPILLATAIIVITVLFFTTIRAQTETATDTGTSTTVTGCNNGGNSDQYLFCIMQNTYGVLTQVNNLPVYMQSLTDLAYSWLTADDSTTTANLQSSFANFANILLTNINSQNALQPKLMGELLPDATTTALPNANDLVYPTLLNMPFFNPDPRNPAGVSPPPYNAPYNYIKNASGINLYHVMPSLAWNGTQTDQKKYANMYYTTISAESFGGYVLSNLYADNQNGNGLSSMQNTLLTQASSSDWFTQIASERIGIVLRQILMFESQAYVLLAQMYAVQKQMLTAQVMSNSLLIILNATNEQFAVTKATGQQPAP